MMVDQPTSADRQRDAADMGTGTLQGTGGRPPLDIGTLVSTYHGDVYRYAYRLTGREAEAEDLTQQTFLIAQQRLAQLREPGKAAGWLFAILRNCFLKDRSRRRPLDAASAELDVDSIPEELTEDDFDRQQLQAAIDELPTEFKLVLVMFYYQGCSYREIAAELQISIGTVMSRLARAKGRLRRRLLGADAPRRARTASPGAPGRPVLATPARDEAQPYGR